MSGKEQLEKRIEELNAELKRKSPRQGVVGTICDMIDGAKGRLNAFNKEDRRFQEVCENNYQRFLSMHQLDKEGTCEVWNMDSGNCVVMYSELGTITRSVDNRVTSMTLPGHAEENVSGKFDQGVTYQGFCLVKDERGVSQYVYVSISDTAYTEVKDESSANERLNVLNGFYRRPDGRFVQIYEKHQPGVPAKHQNLFDSLEARSNDWLKKHGHTELCLGENLDQDQTM